MKRIFYQITCQIISILLLTNCTAHKQVALKKEIVRQIEKSPILNKHFVGFSLYDPITQTYLSRINDDKYFTPASNVKILTLLTYLSIKQDSVATFYQNPKNSNELLTLGDPTFLHEDFFDQPALIVLNQIQHDTIRILYPSIPLDHFGPGWAWDDYEFDFQAERSLFPINGNLISVRNHNNQININPPFFQNSIEFGALNHREKNYNFFQLEESILEQNSRDIFIPFIPDNETIAILLADTIHRSVIISKDTSWTKKFYEWLPVYNAKSSAVLALMMHRSDNFLADQLLVQAQLYRKFTHQEEFLSSVQKTTFAGLPDSLIWVDGSGLSRYNLVTPRSMVHVLKILYDQLTWNEITYIFPTGGRSGTIKNWYTGDPPYVYAKTGTLRHNHALSGYLVTKSGKTLIFSFMNNNFGSSSFKVQYEMQKLLKSIRENY